jgi:hypothetical protein
MAKKRKEFFPWGVSGLPVMNSYYKGKQQSQYEKENEENPRNVKKCRMRDICLVNLFYRS